MTKRACATPPSTSYQDRIGRFITMCSQLQNLQKYHDIYMIYHVG